MGITRTAWTDDDGTGTTGTIINNAVKTELYDQIDAVIQGVWTAFTPTVGGSTSQSGQVHNIQVGRYVLTQKKVEFYCRVSLSTLGTITGSVQIKGLPIAASASSNRYVAVYVGYFSNLTTNYVWLTGFIAPSDTSITLQGLTAAATGVAALAQANLSATSDLIVAGFYETD